MLSGSSFFVLMLDNVDHIVVSVLCSRVYPAGEGTSSDRLCRGTADGDQSLGAAGTRQSAAILKGIAMSMQVSRLTRVANKALGIFCDL